MMNIPRLTHAFDQLGAYTRPLSHFMYEFYENLLDQGFSESQSFALVHSFIQPLADQVWYGAD